MKFPKLQIWYVKSHVWYELGDRAVGNCFLSAACLDGDCHTMFNFNFYAAWCPSHCSVTTVTLFPSFSVVVGRENWRAVGISPWGSSPKSTSLLLLNWRRSLWAGACPRVLATSEKQALMLSALLLTLATTRFIFNKLSTNWYPFKSHWIKNYKTSSHAWLLFKVTSSIIFLRHIGQLFDWFKTDFEHSSHKHRWLQGFTIVLEGSEKQIMHSCPPYPPP